jgi:hypothetical protein
MILTNIYQLENNINSKFNHYYKIHNRFNSNMYYKQSWNYTFSKFYFHYFSNNINEDIKKNYNILHEKNCLENNQPQNICFITGTPLWDNYYEIEFPIKNKSKNKQNIDILICIQLSKIGLMLLHTFQGKSLTENFKIYFKTDNINLIRKHLNNSIYDIIDKIKNQLFAYFLTTMEKYGMVLYNGNMYMINPETNDIFLGILEHDLYDKILLQIKKYSDCYVFPISYEV